MLGGNDLDCDPNYVDLNSIVSNFKEIIKELQQRGISVVVSEIFYRGKCSYTSPRLYHKLRYFLLKRLCYVLKKFHCSYALYPHMDQSWYQKDLVYLNSMGYARVVDTFKWFI